MQHAEGEFSGEGSIKLYRQAWLPANEAQAVLLVVHGLAEHSGRYRAFGEHFAGRGYAVHAFDQRGHGKSGGGRCYVSHFSDYVNDLRVFHQLVSAAHPGKRVFLVGHSVGGTIATAYAAAHPEGLTGLVLSGATLKVGASITPGQVKMARLVSALLPHLGIAPIEAKGVSRDPAVVAAYENDPLVCRGKIPARTGAEILRTMESELPRVVPRITLPVLVMYGTADVLSNPQGSDDFYRLVGSTDKTLKRYEGFYHEIFNEPERLQVFADVERWLAARA